MRSTAHTEGVSSSRRGGLLQKTLLMGSCVCALIAVAIAPAEPPPARQFAPGVRIDWPNLTVELDAEVVMRQGPLELFACSPNTKEHESILRVAARPTHIYQALGLIGLTPGRPIRYDEEKNRWDPPTGDALDIRVRYVDDQGRTVIAAPADWLSTTKPQATPLQLSWVFAGSYTLPDGRFAADIEGTVLCLVDFEAALIAVPALHSADNEQLWLTAKMDAIPPRGAKCALLIRGLYRPAIRVDVARDGSMRHRDRGISQAGLSALLMAHPEDLRPPYVQVCLDPGAEEAVRTEIMKALGEAAGPNARIESAQSPCRFDAPVSVPRP